MDRSNRIEVVPGQAHGVLERTGLTEAHTARAAWTVAGDVRVGGPRAVALMLAISWGTRLPMAPFKVPGVPWLLDRFYEVIARNRTRLPGQTPWCIEHPDQCTPAPTS